MRFVLALLLLLINQSVNAANYEIQVGWQTGMDAQGPQWYSLYFYPSQLTIVYGDSVTWVSSTLEIHNVVFSNGTRRSETQPNGVNLTAIAGVVGNTTHFTNYVSDYSSGFRARNAPAYSLTFLPTTGLGDFAFYCSIHPGMDGIITVLAAGSVAPFTPQQVRDQTQSLIDGMKDAANHQTTMIIASLPQSGPAVSHTVLPDGSINWLITGGQMAHSGGGMQMFARFLPSYVEIQINDTVTWSIGGEDPHWVFFNAQQTFPPIFANYNSTGGQPLNASISYVSPPYSLGITWFSGPAPSPIIPLQSWPNARGYVNSGLMFGPGGPPVFPSSMSVRFTEIGEWRYSCPIHADLGMFGTIRVKPRGSTLCSDSSDQSTCARLSGAVRGDPQFVGLLGQSFQVHGIDGAIYNLITDDDIQVNSKFSFISEDDVISCPQKNWNADEINQSISQSVDQVIKQLHNQPVACWSHDGSYLSEIGVMDEFGNQLSIIAGSSINGFSSIKLNGQSINQSINQSIGKISVSVFSTHHMMVMIDEFTLMIENSDKFINLASVLVDRSRWSSLSSHGLLGQTWHRPNKRSINQSINQSINRSIKHIEGDVDDYLVNDLFGSDFIFNRFEKL